MELVPEHGPTLADAAARSYRDVPQRLPGECRLGRLAPGPHDGPARAARPRGRRPLWGRAPACSSRDARGGDRPFRAEGRDGR